MRELRNEAERVVLGLSTTLQTASHQATNLAGRVSDYEKALILASISANCGHISDTCDSLGLSRRALYDKMQKYGINRADFVDDT